MTPRSRACNRDELIEIINQALDEVEDLRTAIEYDLLTAVNNDEYQVGEGDWLGFLDSLREIDHRAVPFWPLLRLIIETHEKGYQPED